MTDISNKPGRMTGILTLIVGMILLLWPGSTLTTLCTLLGWCLIGSGVFEILIGTIGGKLFVNIGGGITAAIIGIIFITCPTLIISFLPLAVGIITATGGAALLIHSLIVWVLNPLSILTIAGSALAIIVGLILICNPFSAVKLLMVVLGIYLLFLGITRISHS